MEYVINGLLHVISEMPFIQWVFDSNACLLWYSMYDSCPHLVLYVVDYGLGFTTL